jgi:uncharacterized membrane protein
MNKQQFLQALDAALSRLSDEERKDILRDMEEYFHEAMSRGLAEEDVVKKLGSVETLSNTLIAEAKVKRIRSAGSVSKKVGALFSALFAVLLLTPFNLIFVLLPLFLVTLFIVVGWPIVIIVALSLPLIILLGLVMTVHVGMQLFALLAILFFALGWIGLVIAITVGFWYLTCWYFKGVMKLFQWNIKFVKNSMRG